MKFKFEPKRITREEFFNLKEEDLMFITNPGRMGDEDGSTFIIRNGNDYNVYRIDGWMYGDEKEVNYISIKEAFKQFPKWKEAWDNSRNSEYSEKYVYVYMGFGNDLCVDKRVYNEFYPYLLEEVKKQDMYSWEKDDNYNPCLNYPSWELAVEKMINNIQK